MRNIVNDICERITDKRDWKWVKSKNNGQFTKQATTNSKFVICPSFTYSLGSVLTQPVIAIENTTFSKAFTIAFSSPPQTWVTCHGIHAMSERFVDDANEDQCFRGLNKLADFIVAMLAEGEKEIAKRFGSPKNERELLAAAENSYEQSRGVTLCLIQAILNNSGFIDTYLSEQTVTKFPKDTTRIELIRAAASKIPTI